MRIGVDLGGTKIELAALDEAGAVRHRQRVATPAGDYDATVEAVGRLVANADRELGERATVGVATPGALSLATGRIKNANSVCLNGRPLKEDLERRIGRAVRLANDANCFALSEAVDGAARGAEIVFGVILGTGVGGGLSRIARLYDEVPRRWTATIFSDAVRTRLVPPMHGDASGVRGAAWLWNPGRGAAVRNAG